jgi:mutator protein MutT
MSREYPSAPVPAVAVVVVRGDGQVLLVRRGTPPSAGLWSVPGGRLELGETVAECARREVREECGVECAPLRVYHVGDHVFRDDEGRIRYHYLIVDVLARWIAGEPVAASDAEAVGWFALEDLAALSTTSGLEAVVRELIAKAAGRSDGEGGGHSADEVE